MEVILGSKWITPRNFLVGMTGAICGMKEEVPTQCKRCANFTAFWGNGISNYFNFDVIRNQIGVVTVVLEGGYHFLTVTRYGML
jgi:hypothetical protein